MKKPVYLDYAATTPVDPAVAEEMLQRFIHPMLPELEKSLDQEFSGAKKP